MLIKLYFCNARIRYSMDFSFNSKRNAFIDSHSIGWVNSTHRICSTVTNLFYIPKRESKLWNRDMPLLEFSMTQKGLL